VADVSGKSGKLANLFTTETRRKRVSFHVAPETNHGTNFWRMNLGNNLRN
jgi:hypothetical protein